MASSDQSITFEPTTSPRVLLIPIMPDGYSAQQLRQMKSTVDANLADYRYHSIRRPGAAVGLMK
ncbi:MAG: hypothetical protein U0559_01100 [Anaerolineae bacterium]